MPYVDRETVKTLAWRGYAETPGELNYLLTTTCLEYLGCFDKCSYQIYNDIIGALEACKLEFYRRAVSSYEDKKIAENGDVY